MQIMVDIDGTLCGYSNAPEKRELGEKPWPAQDVIDKVNFMYDEGHTITIWTAREEYLRQHTSRQLDSWGVKYHDLLMGKPVFDMMVDDRAINVMHWMNDLDLGRVEDKYVG